MRLILSETNNILPFPKLYSNPLPSNLVTLRDEKFAIQSAKFVRSFGGCLFAEKNGQNTVANVSRFSIKTLVLF